MPVSSPNFWFLEEHSPTLVLYAARAEFYVFDDPNTSLLKLRQFAELLATHTAAFGGLDTSDVEFANVLALLRRQRLISRDVGDLFDLLRLRGNEAMHAGGGDRRTALVGLVTAHNLACWFQEHFSKQPFARTPFRPPPNPTNLETDLRQELEELREEAATYKQELEETQGVVRAHDELLHEQARELEDQFSQLRKARDLLAASEERQESERRHYQKELAELSERMRHEPPEQLWSYVDRSRWSAELHKLGTVEAETAWLAQVRFVGPRPCRYCSNATFLAQYNDYGWVTAFCSRCRRGNSVRDEELGQLELCIVCPTCGSRMVDGRVVDNKYGHLCEECGTRCLLSNLLPSAADIDMAPADPRAAQRIASRFHDDPDATLDELDDLFHKYPGSKQGKEAKKIRDHLRSHSRTGNTS